MAKSWPKWPSKMTPEAIQKLEESFKYWLTDEEACLECDVSTSSFYDYQAKHPEFKAKKEALKRTPNIAAKRNWLKEINGGNYQASKEWLERRAKDEFSLKQEIDQSNTNADVTDNLSEDQKKKLTERFTKKYG